MSRYSPGRTSSVIGSWLPTQDLESRFDVPSSFDFWVGARGLESQAATHKQPQKRKMGACVRPYGS